MGLIICPTCNNSVSSEAVTCPHCGHPLRRILKKEPIGCFGIAMGIVLAVIIISFG